METTITGSTEPLGTVTVMTRSEALGMPATHTNISGGSSLLDASLRHLGTDLEAPGMVNMMGKDSGMAAVMGRNSGMADMTERESGMVVILWRGSELVVLNGSITLTEMHQLCCWIHDKPETPHKAARSRCG